jgi:hypothetical protein
MTVTPGAASTLLRPVLTGSDTRGRVIAVLGRCVYAAVSGELVAVEAARGHRLPCSVLLADGIERGAFASVRPGDPTTAGGGRLRLGALQVAVRRWWRPAAPCDAVPVLPRRDLTGTPRDPGWDRLALSLLGLGPGLTPAGDDLLCGLLVGLAGRPDLRDPLAAAVLSHAARRTTFLSAELLRHAAAGLAAPAVVAVADALAGHGDDAALARCLPRLLALGHTSGRALAQGLLLAAGTVARHPIGSLEAA